MGKIARRGTPEQLLNMVENKLEDLNASEDVSSCNETPITSSDDVDEIEEELTRKFEAEGYDVSAEAVINTIQAAAEYLEMYKDEGEDYSVDEWWEDTKMNYPEVFEDIEEFKYSDQPIESAENMGFDDLIYEVIQAATDEVYGRHGEIIDDVEMEYFEGYDQTKDAILTAVTLDDEHDNEILNFELPISMLTLDEDSISDDADVIADDIDVELDEYDEY